LNLRKSLNKLLNIIYKNEKFLILTHTYPDGDGLGSLIALYRLISKLKKKAIMICNDEIPYHYQFLPYINNIKRNLDNVDSGENEYITICLDSADKNRLKLDFDKLKEKSKQIINIDHHLSNTNFGDLNIVIPEKSATAEIICELIFLDFKAYLSHEIALCLYTGILTDTGKFQYSNTTPRVHEIVSNLIKYDINPSNVFSRIYENEPYNRFKLLQLVLGRIKLIESVHLAYSYILRRDFDKLNLPYSSHDGIIELLRSAKDVKVAALLREIGRNCFKISLRSSSNDINVAEIAGVFAGGGHVMASAYTQHGKLKDIISDLVVTVRNRNR